MSDFDPVSRPAHYADTAHQPDDVIEAWGLGFRLGSAVKYICRCGKKAGADPVEDLKKAAWYLAKEIERREEKAAHDKDRSDQ